MTCTQPYITKLGDTVPCGRCLSCRIQRSREIATRCIHELGYWSHATFVTLTYSDEYLPKRSTLVKSHLQSFFKLLRTSRKVKYFACGEYGDNTHRPHYHVILFGVSSDEVDLVKSCWPFGLIHFGEVTYDSCRYVADYVFKSYSGKLAEVEFYSEGRIPPFRLISNGIGRRYCLDHADQFRYNLFFYLRDGIKMSLPRYYRSVLGIDKSNFVPRALERDEAKRIIEFKRVLKQGVIDALNNYERNRQYDLNLRARLVKNDRDFEIKT